MAKMVIMAKMAIMAIVWLNGHMAIQHYRMECTQDGYLIQGYNKCRINIKYISKSNESKKRFWEYIFHINTFMKLKMVASNSFNLENSNLFCIDLFYPIPMVYQLPRLIFDFLEHLRAAIHFGLKKLISPPKESKLFKNICTI